jgi:HPt (histidine-containing phosphotransfer) domain-containing protein
LNSYNKAAIHEADYPLDRRVLAELAEMQRNGRPGFMDRVITMFLKVAPQLIAELEAGSAADRLAVLQRASHTLKPCSATVGAASLAALCETLEFIAKSGAVSDPDAQVAAIAEEYKRVEAALITRLDAG